MQLIAQYIVVALKFIIPALLLWFPFPAAWANYFLDVFDGDILQHFGMEEYTYQTVDKIADYVSYIFMLILGRRWKIKKLITALFIYRTIGQALFFITRDELALFYFMNFLEPLVMAYTFLLFKFKSEKKAYASYKKHLVLIWAIIIGYKVFNEWYLHFANFDMSTVLFGLNGGGV